MILLRMLVLLLVAAATAVAQSDGKSSKTPPAGPPWVRNFSEARAAAIKAEKPIFVYSTKTY